MGRQLRCNPYLKGNKLKEYLEDLNSRRLLLEDLLPNTSKADLRSHFEAFGDVENAYAIAKFG